MFTKSIKPICKCTYSYPIIFNRNFAKAKDPFFEAIIDVLEPKETLYSNIFFIYYLEKTYQKNCKKEHQLSLLNIIKNIKKEISEEELILIIKYI